MEVATTTDEWDSGMRPLRDKAGPLQLDTEEMLHLVSLVQSFKYTHPSEYQKVNERVRGKLDAAYADTCVDCGGKGRTTPNGISYCGCAS